MNETKNITPATPKSDTVKVRVLTQILLDRTMRDGTTISETYAEPGDVIELPRLEAERLAGRSFTGYPTMRDAKWTATECGGAVVAPMPNFHTNGVVSDPIVEIVKGG